MSYLFNDSLDNIKQLHKVALEKISNLEDLLSEKNKIIEELKNIIYKNDYISGDSSEGEAGVSGYFFDGDGTASYSSSE